MTVLPYEITQAYEALVADLEDKGISGGCGSIKPNRPLLGCFKSLDAERVHFECYLHLKEWKFRGVSPKRIHILLHAQEQIRRSDRILLSSTVQVSYFTVENTNATLLQSIHFDYGPNQDAHPLFHAQVTNKPISLPANETDSLEFDFQVVLPAHSWFRDARIPTSDMTFPSVLLCLAADHLGPSFFNAFLKKVRDLQKKMPCSSFEDLKASLAAEPNHFRSSHWFAHCSPKAE